MRAPNRLPALDSEVEELGIVRTLFLASALSLLLVACTVTPPRTAASGEHVVVYHDSLPEYARRMQQEADRTVREVAWFMGLEPPGKRAEVLLFDSGKALRRYLEKESPYHAKAGAACIIRDDEYVLAISRRMRDDEAMAFLRHELVHYIISSHYAGLPPWISEGLAQFFEPGEPYGRANPNCLKTLAPEPRDDEQEILSWVVALPEGVLLNDREYAHAWRLTHFLLLNERHGVTAVKRYLNAVAAGGNQTGEFEEAFGCPPSDLEPALRQHINRRIADNWSIVSRF